MVHGLSAATHFLQSLTRTEAAEAVTAEWTHLYIVVTYVVLAYIAMAHTVMAHIVMVNIVMA